MDQTTPTTVPAVEPLFCGQTAATANRFREEALARFAAYKKVGCTAEKWDRMCALLDLARDHLKHTACIDEDATRCPACALESEIDEMLKGAR